MATSRGAWADAVARFGYVVLGDSDITPGRRALLSSLTFCLLCVPLTVSFRSFRSFVCLSLQDRRGRYFCVTAQVSSRSRRSTLMYCLLFTL